MTYAEALQAARINLRPMGREIGVSASALSRITTFGEYPIRLGPAETKRRISDYLSKRGIDATEIVWPERLPEETKQPSLTEGIELMQLDRNVLTLFGLRTNPFINDIESDADVLHYKGYEVIEQAIHDAIEQRAFLAIVADSGAGKTTIWDGIEAEYGAREDTIVCKPSIKSREELTPEHLARTLIYGLAGDDVKIKTNAEDRGRQLSQALRNIRNGVQDRKAVLYIDDAHFCSASVLRQLKTFFEEKVGRYRLLSIILVGLPTLKNKLSEFAEVGNRVRLVEVPPIPVQEYLKFKLERVGSTLGRLFEDDGLAAFVDRFRTSTRRPPLGRPLVINAMCIRAMVRLYQNGAQNGERITREIIDTLPGDAPVRKAA